MCTCVATSSIFTAASEDSGSAGGRSSSDDDDCDRDCVVLVFMLVVEVMCWLLLLSVKTYRTAALGRQLWLAADADQVRAG